MRWRVAGMHASEAGRLLQTTLGAGGEVKVTSDLEGVQEVMGGEADLFMGICATGAGGALAMAQVFLGPDRCLHVDGNTTGAQIAQALVSGVVCFGLPADQLRFLIPVLVETVAKHRM
jgi:hypothetical protein